MGKRPEGLRGLHAAGLSRRRDFAPHEESTKHESRSPKQRRMTRAQNPKQGPALRRERFDHLDFAFVSDFDLRISNFRPYQVGEQ